MKAGGWMVDWAPNQDAHHAARCGGYETFWAYSHGDGFVKATFKGSGKGVLDFGNCYSTGFTKVYLNDTEIGSAPANESSKVINFNYTTGDTLKITEEQIGIIKINSLHLQACGNAN